MNKKARLFISVVALGVAGFLASGCQSAANSGPGSTSPGQNTASANAANTTTAAVPAATVSPDAGQPSAAYKAAYAARASKNVAALKALISKETQNFLAKMGSADPKKKQSLDDVLKEICASPQAKTDEVRNEVIQGDTATIEAMDEDGGWQKMALVKEDGAWKLSIGRPDALSADAPAGLTPDESTTKKK